MWQNPVSHQIHCRKLWIMLVGRVVLIVRRLGLMGAVIFLIQQWPMLHMLSIVIGKSIRIVGEVAALEGLL